MSQTAIHHLSFWVVERSSITFILLLLLILCLLPYHFPTKMCCLDWILLLMKDYHLPVLMKLQRVERMKNGEREEEEKTGSESRLFLSQLQLMRFFSLSFSLSLFFPRHYEIINEEYDERKRKRREEHFGNKESHE